jgi:acetylornithine aminotransferase
MALAEHLLINVTADNVVRLLPPLVMNEAEARELVQRLAAVIKLFLQS